MHLLQNYIKIKFIFQNVTNKVIVFQSGFNIYLIFVYIFLAVPVSMSLMIWILYSGVKLFVFKYENEKRS